MHTQVGSASVESVHTEQKILLTVEEGEWLSQTALGLRLDRDAGSSDAYRGGTSTILVIGSKATGRPSSCM